MDPTVASTTKIHRAGLSTITEGAESWIAGAVSITWPTTAGRGGSEGRGALTWRSRDEVKMNPVDKMKKIISYIFIYNQHF